LAFLNHFLKLHQLPLKNLFLFQMHFKFLPHLHSLLLTHFLVLLRLFHRPPQTLNFLPHRQFPVITDFQVPTFLTGHQIHSFLLVLNHFFLEHLVLHPRLLEYLIQPFNLHHKTLTLFSFCAESCHHSIDLLLKFRVFELFLFLTFGIFDYSLSPLLKTNNMTL
jgi:hypothetical protein